LCSFKVNTDAVWGERFDISVGKYGTLRRNICRSHGRPSSFVQKNYVVKTNSTRFILLFLFSAIGVVALHAQSTLLSGRVFEKRSKDPLIGASVSVKGGFDGATTDTLGRFRFSTDESGAQVLLVTYVGYKPQEMPLNLDGKPQSSLSIGLEEEPASIGEVVISAGAFEASDEKKGVVLTPLDIVTVPGANGDITGALNTLPGTTVNGETGQLIVRGGAASETRVYIDGLAVRNFYTSALPDVPARSRFSPFQFKGTTFSSGGYSAEFGQALSAALSLNTPDMPTQGGFNIGISPIGLNGGYTRLKSRSAISFFASYNNLGPYMKVVKQKVNFFTPPESGAAGVEGRIKTGQLGIVKYGIQGTLNRVRIGYNPAPFETTAFSMGIINKNTRGFLSWRTPAGDRWTLYGGLQGELNKDDFTPNTFSAFTNKNYAASGRFTATYTPGARLRWKSGGEYNLAHFSNSFVPRPIHHQIGALFSELETYLGDRTVLRAGLRGERDFLLQRNNLAPRLSAAYKTGRASQISASWGIFYQAPEDTLLYYTTRLNFERAQHYILNYQTTRGGRIFRLEAFYKKYEQLVRSVPEFSNTGDGYAQGVELFFRDRTTFKWGDYWISYSYLDTRRLWRAYPQSAMPTFAATHNASFVYKYFFSKPQISANLSYTVQSGRPYFNPENPEFLADRTPVYHNLSLQAAKLTNIRGHFTIFVVSVTNVLGSKQVFNYRFTPVPNTTPVEYYRQTIGPVAPRFIFAGCFINIGDKRTKVSKDEALE
jgi:vitamin B12 transporter